jgi:hypothetical protein
MKSNQGNTNITQQKGFDTDRATEIQNQIEKALRDRRMSEELHLVEQWC